MVRRPRAPSISPLRWSKQFCRRLGEVERVVRTASGVAGAVVSLLSQARRAVVELLLLIVLLMWAGAAGP